MKGVTCILCFKVIQRSSQGHPVILEKIGFWVRISSIYSLYGLCKAKLSIFQMSTIFDDDSILDPGRSYLTKMPSKYPKSPLYDGGLPYEGRLPHCIYSFRKVSRAMSSYPALALGNLSDTYASSSILF